MRVPTVVQAETLLAAGGRRNPGPWVAHSRVAARAARTLAEHHPTLDADVAYVLGLLHDIGRSTWQPGVPDVRHLLDGYALLRDQGYEDAARICLTHSFPLKDVDAFASPWDCPVAERRFVQDYLARTEYTAYDRLIQLCDGLALPTGCCLLEKRLVDVALRHGVNVLTVAKWRAYLDVQRELEGALGTSVYRLLPDVVETTFGSGSGVAAGAPP